MPQFTVIYDFINRSADWEAMITPVILLLIGGGMVYYYARIVNPKEKNVTGGSKRFTGLLFSLVYTTLAFCFCVALSSTFRNYDETKRIYASKQYKTVVGRVKHYHPMPSGGHDTERFEVDGVPFNYSDYDLTDYGYNNATSNGGVIRPDLLVRISYFNNGYRNVILKLEICG